MSLMLQGKVASLEERVAVLEALLKALEERIAEMAAGGKPLGLKK